MVDSQPTSVPVTPTPPPRPVEPPPIASAPSAPTLSVAPPPTPPTPPSPTPTSPSKSGMSKLILFVVALVLVVAVAGGWYWYAHIYQNSSGVIIETNPEPSAPPDNAMIACTMDAKICPDGSSVGRTGPNCEFAQCPGNATSEICRVAMTMPPEDFAAGHDLNEQDQNREWVFTEQEYTGNQLFTNMASLNFTTIDGLGSGYVPGNVTIQCGSNTQNITNEALFSAYQEWVIGQGTSDMPLTIQRTGEATIGGQPAIAFTISGGAFDPELVSYLVTTPEKVYLINQVSMSPDQLIQDTTQQIFDSITFLPNQ